MPRKIVRFLAIGFTRGEALRKKLSRFLACYEGKGAGEGKIIAGSRGALD